MIAHIIQIIKHCSKFKRLLALLLLMPVAVLADEGDELAVSVNIVNLRAAAESDSEVLLKLGQGRRVVEINRQGSWVLVATEREDVPRGWISQSFLKPYQAIDGVETFFDLFELAFEEYHKNLQGRSELVYFSQATDLGDGDVQVMVASAWFLRLESDRNEDLKNIFAIWGAIVGDEISHSVSIVDTDEDLLMSMMK